MVFAREVHRRTSSICSCLGKANCYRAHVVNPHASISKLHMCFRYQAKSVGLHCLAATERHVDATRLHPGMAWADKRIRCLRKKQHRDSAGWHCGAKIVKQPPRLVLLLAESLRCHWATHSASSNGGASGCGLYQFMNKSACEVLCKAWHTNAGTMLWCLGRRQILRHVAFEGYKVAFLAVSNTFVAS